jgi:hypothetical protein
MLRLAHRILSQTCSLHGLELPAAINDADKHTLKKWHLSEPLRRPEVGIVIADNVAAYLHGTYVKWSDVEPIAPPLPKMLVIWRSAHYRGCCEHGASLETTVVHDLNPETVDSATQDAFALAARFGVKYEATVFEDVRPNTPSPSCIISAFAYYVDEKGGLMRSGVPAFFLVHRGRLLSIIEPMDLLVDKAREGNWARPALTAIAFMNCKNVQRIDVTREEGPRPKWCRRQRVAELKYHALQIDPNLGVKPQVGERKTESDRSGMALHICRGHFAHFRDDGVSQGLFGRRHFGTFWIPAHTRGSLAHGRVISTYNVKTPA